MTTRTTQLGVEAIEVVRNTARASQLGAEFVYAITHNQALLTTLGAEFIYRVVPDAHVTTLGVEFAYKRAAACTAIIIRPATTADVAAVADAQFIVAAADADLPNARVATNTATVAWDNTTAGQSKASVIAGSIGATQLDDTAVTPGTYGDGTNVAQITVDANGRVTGVTDVAITATGGGGAWTLAATHAVSVGGEATVDFTGLTGTDFLIVCRGVAQSVSGILQCRLSVNNGSSYYSTSGDYINISTAGVETNAAFIGAFHITAATAARSGATYFPGVGVNGGVKAAISITASAGANNLFVASTSPVNAIRVLSSGGGNISGGTIYVFQR